MGEVVARMIRGSKMGALATWETEGRFRAAAYPPDESVRTGEVDAATRPESGRSGLEATCRRVPLTRRGRAAVVVGNGMLMTSSMLRPALPGMGILADRVGREDMVCVVEGCGK